MGPKFAFSRTSHLLFIILPGSDVLGFFDVCIFYANLKFPASLVHAEKEGKYDILKKKISRLHVDDRGASFLG